MKLPKLPVVKEYGDTFLVDGKEIPYVIMKENGDTTTKVKAEGGFIKVTVTFLAKSYTLDPHKRIHGSTYKFKLPWYKRLKRLLKKLLLL